MKKLSFLALAAVGLLFGACASDGTIDEKSVSEQLKGREGSYISVGINLPTATGTSTRAGWTEEDGTTPILDSGLPVEYNVQSALLLIFSGTSEADATLAQVESLTPNFANVADDPDQITTNSKHAILLKTSGTYVGALAVLNGAGIIEKVSDNSVSVLGATKTGIKVSDLQDEIASANTNGSPKFIYEAGGNTYFFMTNAVLSDTRGGVVEPAGAKVSVLAPVDLTKTYTTEDDALAGEASADIYVERGVAKVTIEQAASGFLEITGWKKDGAAYTGVGMGLQWTLDNTNKKSYVVRRVDMPETDFAWNIFNTKSADDKYRFIGTSSVDKFYTSDKTKTSFRTYWAKDPNYKDDFTDVQLKSEFYNPGSKTFSTSYGPSNPQYCYENTFDVKHQTYKNTTRAIIGVTLNGGTDFYTVGDNQTTLYTETGMKDLVKAQLLTIGAFNTWFSTSGKGTLDAANIVINFSSSEPGEINVTSVTIKAANTLSGLDETISDAGIISQLNASVSKIKFYKEGKSYYVIRIKHFGDQLTPWNSGEGTPKESAVSDIYPGLSAPLYLGRYGMVRNNWYYLTIGKILKVGYPTVPNISTDPDNPDPKDPDHPGDPDHPDDSLEDLYIQAKINILSWAKRPQDWNLK